MDRAGITLAAMACFMCQHELQPAYRFCPNCGAAVWQQGAAAGPVENDLQEIITGYFISCFEYGDYLKVLSNLTQNVPISIVCRLWGKSIAFKTIDRTLRLSLSTHTLTRNLTTPTIIESVNQHNSAQRSVVSELTTTKRHDKNIIGFLSKYHHVEMSIATLRRRLKTYGLKRRNAMNVSNRDLQNVVRNKLDGPSCVAGYRSVWHTLCLTPPKGVRSTRSRRKKASVFA